MLAAELTNFYEYAMCGKWLSLLKELAPSVARRGLAESRSSELAGYRQSIATAAPSLGVEAIASGVRSPAEIDIAIDALARASAGGLLVLPDTFNTVHRDRIVAAAVRHRLTAIYPSRFLVAGGGLMSYGCDLVELMRLAATYVDRILRGATPHDLPIQSSTNSSW